MGTCQCQDENKLSSSQIIFQQKPIKNLTPVTHEPSAITSSGIKPINNSIVSQHRYDNSPNTPVPVVQQKPPSREPSQSFAVPIDKFPSLSQKILQVDRNLGQFKPNSEISLDPNIQPKYIKTPYRLYNGIIYQGEWYNGCMYGMGHFYLPDHSYLKGYSINNELIGQARFIKENGNYYQGQIKNNKANGEGVLYENGILYKGNFVDNFLEGKGTEEAPNYKYEGQYHNGSKTFGRLMWDLDRNIPSIYEGGFFDEQFNGEGKLSNQIGQYQGRFENGKKKGRGIFRWRNGERFEGIYSNNMKNGEGKMYNAKDVVVLQGVWKNDKFAQQS